MATEVLYQVSSTPEKMVRAAANRLLAQIECAVNERGVARIAISGGETPRPLFELLANLGEPYAKSIPWAHLELYWVDERCVPPDQPDSNYRMTREAMLTKILLPEDQIFRMEGELDPAEASTRYEATIRRQFQLKDSEVPVFDAISLGMGDDGHTASLFPHTAALHEQRHLVVANHVPQKDTWRITLTLPVLLAARDVSFLIQGAVKAQVLKDVLLGPYDPEKYPSQLIQPASGKLVLLLDEAAAAGLPPVGEDGWGQLEIAR